MFDPKWLSAYITSCQTPSRRVPYRLLSLLSVTSVYTTREKSHVEACICSTYQTLQTQPQDQHGPRIKMTMSHLYMRDLVMHTDHSTNPFRQSAVGTDESYSCLRARAVQPFHVLVISVSRSRRQSWQEPCISCRLLIENLESAVTTLLAVSL